MASSSTSRTTRGKPGSHNRTHRMIPVAASSSHLMHPGSDSTLTNIDISGAGHVGAEPKNTDSSVLARELVQTGPEMEPERTHDGFVFTFNENTTLASPFHTNFGQSTGEKIHGHFDQQQQYQAEAMSVQTMSGPSYDRSSAAQSASTSSGGTNSPLATIQGMQPTRPPYYSTPMASNSQEGIDDELYLLTSTSDTPPFLPSHAFEHGGSPGTDANALHSDSESHGLSHHGAPKSGYRREIEAKSRNKIRLASQRLRNVISPHMRPGVSLRGAADVMEEAADQIRRLSDRMREMDAQIRGLRAQLESRQPTQHNYDGRMMH